MGRNARRRAERRRPLKRLGRLVSPLVTDPRTGAPGLTFRWDPSNPAERRRVRRLVKEAHRLGYPIHLEDPDAT